MTKVKKVFYCWTNQMISVCMLLLFCLNTPLAAESILYGTIGEPPAGLNNVLVTIDQNTGAVTQVIGFIGFQLSGLAFDPTTNNLYGTTSVNDPNYNGLIIIDKETGAGTPIGSDWGGVPMLFLTSNSMGQLYAYSYDRNLGEINSPIMQIDKSTGVFTPIGIPNLNLTSLDFDSSDVLWATDSPNPYASYIIDATTGQATFVANCQAFQHHGKFNPDTGQFWGIDNNNPFNPTRAFIILDLASGALLNTIQTVDFLHTLAFFVPIPPPQPPAFIKGKQEKNKFLTQTQFFNKIIWTRSPSKGIIAYRIYRNGVLIAEVSSSFFYVDPGQKNQAVEYSVTSVNSNGLESTPITIVITS